MLVQSLLISLYLFFSLINGYKILIYNPKIGHSHVNFMSQMTRLLVDAGHDVLVVSSNIDKSLKDPFHLPGKIYYSKPHIKLVELVNNKDHVENMWKSTRNILGQMTVVNVYKEALRHQGIAMIEDKDLENFILSQHFDLAIAELKYPFMFGIFKRWNIVATVATCSSALYDSFYTMFGIPYPISYVPSIISGYNDKMTYKERLMNLINHVVITNLFSFEEKYATLKDVFDEKYGEEFYDAFKIITNCSFILINSNPFLDIPTPKSPKMIEISGIGIPEPNPVDEYYNEILNRRNKTVLISFGTAAKSTYMDQDMKNGILKTIKSLPEITFIWKYETPEDGIGKGVDNLVLSKWVPQNDLLNDKRLSLFVTHAGMGSTTEAAFSNAPVLAVPVFGDQMRNAKLFERLEIGLTIDKEVLRNSIVFREKILEILNNDKYRTNSIRTAEMLKNRPISSEQLLVKHVEFACRFGQL
uniref:UDP-glucuronosyltransferase n=1 Tax=Parastrongyloides trichosuri TaxID=131310 RepID=A0A0N4ZLT5_PARTI